MGAAAITFPLLPAPPSSGTMINLKHPYNATSFLPANINLRVSELQKPNNDVYGKAGFWEEFEVCVYCGKGWGQVNSKPVCLVTIATAAAGV